MSEILIEHKPVALGIGGNAHLYLVYRNVDDEEYVIRGGPARGRIDLEIIGQRGFGSIVTESGVPMQDSEDRRAATPGDLRLRHSRSIDLGQRDADDVWLDMLDASDRVHHARIDYDAPGPNSNTTVAYVLKCSGINVRKVVKQIYGTINPGWAFPGIDDVSVVENAIRTNGINAT